MNSRSGVWSRWMLQAIGRSSSKLFEGHFGPCEHRWPLGQRAPAYYVSASPALLHQRHLRCSPAPLPLVARPPLCTLPSWGSCTVITLAATTLEDLHRTHPKPPTYMCSRSFSSYTRTQLPFARPVWHRVRSQGYTYRHGILTVSSRSPRRRSLEREVHTVGRLHPWSQR